MLLPLIHPMGILESIATFLVALWIIGLLLHVAGGFIHLLLVIAIVLYIARFIRGQR